MKNTYYIEKTSNGATGVTFESKLFEKRVLYLDTEVSRETVNELIRQIIVLEEENNSPITMVIDSPGGNIQAGLALIDVMKGCSCEIRTLVLGMAASMGAVIAAAGTKGQRYISEHSRVMVHEPLLQSGVTGSCSSIQATAKAIMDRKNLLNSLLAEYTGNDVQSIERATSFDNDMHAAEALVFGLVDKLVGGTDLLEIMKGE